MMDAKSAQKLTKVHSELARRVTAAIIDLESQGRDVRVVQGFRTYAEQNALFAQGRTEPGEIVTKARGGQSNHNFGLAIDLCPFVNGDPDWNDSQGFRAIGVAGKKQGLEWGGDWKKFRDMPHLELPGPKLDTCRALYDQGGVEAVWKRTSEMLSHAIIDPVVKESLTAQHELRKGAKGEAVKRLQLALRAHGEMVEVDGDFGKQTDLAVRSFQTGNNLRVDGRVGPNTLKALGLL